jgi:outer membrane receptor protein involved in Fe transport
MRQDSRSALLLYAAAVMAGPSAAVAQPADANETVVQAAARLPDNPILASEFPAAVQVVTREEIAQSGAVTLQEVLESLPGVHLNDEQGNALQPDITMRGTTVSSVTGLSQGISVFVDGVRVNEPDADEVNFDLIPLEEVERVEVIRGPSAAFGRNSLAGTINIVTRRGHGPLSAEGEASAGSFGRESYRLQVSGGTAFDYYFAAQQFSEHGFRDNSDARTAQVFAKVGFSGKDGDAAISYQYHNDRIHQAGSLPQSLLEVNRRANFTFGDFFAPQLHQATLNGSIRLPSGFSLTASAFLRALDAEQFNSSLLAPDTRLFNRTRSAGGIVQLSHRARLGSFRNHAILGAEYTHDSVTVRLFEEQNERSLARCQSVSDDCPFSRYVADLSDSSNPFAFYLFDTLRVGSGLLARSDFISVSAGVRVDRIDHGIVDQSPEQPGQASGTAVFTRVTPTAGLSYGLSDEYSIYVAYKEGFRAPAFLELTCANPGAPCVGLQAGVAPDPSFSTLRPIKARSYEAGFRAKPASWLDASAAVFRTDLIDDIYSVSPAPTAVYFQNVGNTRRQGVELSISSAAGPFGGLLNYTYTRATFESDFSIASPRTPGEDEEVKVGDQLPLVPNHRLNLAVHYSPLSWARFSFAGTYVGDQFFRGDEHNTQPKLSAYFILAARVDARWRSLSAFVQINNVLNTHYETFGTYANSGTMVEPFLTPGAPTRVTAGVSLRL